MWCVLPGVCLLGFATATKPMAKLCLDYPSFLSRHDMKWHWTEDRGSWPWSWQTGAWLGNGLHGITVQLDKYAENGALRLELGRTDVWSCGYAPRMPIAHIRVSFKGTILEGTMRQSLHEGIVTGAVKTTAGTVQFKVWTAASAEASVLSINGTGGESQVTAILVAEEAKARLNPILPSDLFTNPPASCATATGTSLQVCTQHLSCDASGMSHYSTVVRELPTSDTKTFVVSVGNVQPTARMYPPTPASITNATLEAIQNIDQVATNLPGQYKQHLAWWAAFYSTGNGPRRRAKSTTNTATATDTRTNIDTDTDKQGSFVSVPDTRLEAFYHIQQAKAGAATREVGAPLVDQTGPFRLDMAVKCSREPKGINGTGWPFQMWDWNVEESYFGFSRANRGELVGSLKLGLKAGIEAMEANAQYLLNTTAEEGAMVLGQGLGQNLVDSPGGGSLFNVSAVNRKRLTRIVRGLPFAANVIWRACSAVLDTDCLHDDVFPLLRGAIATYDKLSHIDNATGVVHLGDVGWESSTAPPGHQQDSTWNLALWSWSCRVFLELLPAVSSSLRRAQSNTSTSTKQALDNQLAVVCARVQAHLATYPVNKTTGALLVARLPNGTGVPWNQQNQMGVELGFPIWPLGTMTLETDAKTTLATADEYMNQDCSNTYSCDDLVWTIRAGVSAVAGRGDAVHSNLTAFLNTDRHRLARNGSLFPPGCSEPCAHCQPCVGANTMVEEGANPILEGGIVIGANLQDMLLADYILPALYPTNQTLVKVFPAVPSYWHDAVFFRLRALNGILVSAVRRNGSTAWVEVISEGGHSVVLDTTFASAPVLTAGSSSVVMKQLSGGHTYLISGFGRGGWAILHELDRTDFTVEALKGNPAEHNYYGFHPTSIHTDTDIYL